MPKAVSLGIQLGVNLGKRLGISLNDPTSKRLLYALTNLSAANYFATAAAGGEAGVATGFGALEQFRLDALPASAVQVLTARASFGGNTGFILWINNGVLTALVSSQAGSLVASPTRTLLSSDIGKIHTALLYFDGTKVRLWLDRDQMGDGLGAMTGYTTANVAQSLGALQGTGSYPATGCSILSELTFRGTPTDAALRDMFDAVRSTGDVPSTLAGAVVTHRHSLRDQLRNAPAVARKLLGARGYSAANYLTSGADKGIKGAAAGFVIHVPLMFDRLPAVGEILFGYTNSAASAGYFLQCQVTTLRAWAGAYSSTRTITAADVLQPHLVSIRCTGTAVQLFWDGVQQGADVAATYTAPAAGQGEFRLGNWAGGQFFSAGAIFGAMGGAIVGGGTLSQLQQVAADFAATGKLVPPTGMEHLYDLVQDLAANGGTVPATALDRIGTENLARAGALSDAPYADLVAPAQLTDTVTQASNDALVKVGTPVVVAIDPTIDGRTTKGVLGFSAASYLEHPTTMRGAAPAFNVEAEFEIAGLGASAIRMIAATRDQGQPGWSLYTFNSNGWLAFVASSAAGPTGVAQIALSAADIGIRLRCVGWIAGGSINLLLRRPNGDTLVTAAMTGTFAAAPVAFRVGARAVDGLPADNLSIFAVAGGHTAVDQTIATAMLEAASAAGRLVRHSAMEHLWDFTADIAANAGELPVQFLDRIGTDHLARLDIDTPKVGPNGVRGVGPYAATDGWRTATGGGIQGSGSGFSFVLDVNLTKVPSASEMLLCACSSGGATQGYYFQTHPSGLLRMAINNALTAQYQLTASDVGKRLRFLLQYTGTVMRMYGPYTAAQFGSDAAATLVAPSPPVPMQVGGFDGAQNFSSGWIELVQGGPVVLSPTEITAVFADLTQPPPLTAGQKRWRFHDDTSSTPTKTPRTSIERVGGAAADVLTRYGAGLQVAQRVERLFSYEVSPIMKAGRPSSGNRWEGAQSTAVGGDPLGFFVAIMGRPKGSTTGRVASNTGGGPQGWSSNLVSGSQWQFIAVDASGTNKQAPLVVVAADGKTRCGLWVVDMPASLLRAYHNRAQVGSGTAMTGYATANLSLLGLTIGALYGGSLPQPDFDFQGLVYGLGTPTLAQFQAWEDACMATEDIVALDGATHLYSVKRGLVGTTLKDLIGSYDIPVVGAPSTVDIYDRAFAR